MTDQPSGGSEELTELRLQQKLTEYRESLEMTQTKFAEHYGWATPTSVSLWESGKRKIPNIVCIDIFNWLIEQEKASAIQQFADGLVEKSAIFWETPYSDDDLVKAVPISTIQAAAKAVQEGGR